MVHMQCQCLSVFERERLNDLLILYLSRMQAEPAAWAAPSVSGYVHCVPMKSGAAFPESLMKLDYKCIIVEVTDLV